MSTSEPKRLWVHGIPFRSSQDRLLMSCRALPRLWTVKHLRWPMCFWFVPLTGNDTQLDQDEGVGGAQLWLKVSLDNSIIPSLCPKCMLCRMGWFKKLRLTNLPIPRRSDTHTHTRTDAHTHVYCQTLVSLFGMFLLAFCGQELTLFRVAFDSMLNCQMQLSQQYCLNPCTFRIVRR